MSKLVSGLPLQPGETRLFHRGKVDVPIVDTVEDVGEGDHRNRKADLDQLPLGASRRP